jgi:hypothetical protein
MLGTGKLDDAGLHFPNSEPTESRIRGMDRLCCRVKTTTTKTKAGTIGDVEIESNDPSIKFLSK